MQWVYFVQASTPTDFNGPVKIGIALNPSSRLMELQTGNPYLLLLRGYRAGGVDLERELHKRFESWRLNGEWFDADAPGLDEEMAIAASHEELYEVFDAQVCVTCEREPVVPPKMRFCSPECAETHARFRSREWKRAAKRSIA